MGNTTTTLEPLSLSHPALQTSTTVTVAVASLGHQISQELGLATGLTQHLACHCPSNLHCWKHLLIFSFPLYKLCTSIYSRVLSSSAPLNNNQIFALLFGGPLYNLLNSSTGRVYMGPRFIPFRSTSPVHCGFAGLAGVGGRGWLRRPALSCRGQPFLVRDAALPHWRCWHFKTFSAKLVSSAVGCAFLPGHRDLPPRLAFPEYPLHLLFPFSCPMLPNLYHHHHHVSALFQANKLNTRRCSSQFTVHQGFT